MPPFSKTILSASMSLSSFASTSMQKTLMSLWGFATANFHGKSSVLCLCHHCQVLIIHRDDSQSKAETQMCPCHRTPPGWEKPCLYIRRRNGTDSHWLASIASWLWIHFDDQALSKCIKQWPSGSHMREKCPTDCEKLISVVCSSLITLLSFVSSRTIPVLNRALLNHAK